MSEKGEKAVKKLFKDRVVGLKRIKAKDLLPNPKNWRTHPEQQRAVLNSVLGEIGIADRLLARELDDGRYMLIDGHCRQEEYSPEQKVPVLLLDVTEEEADLLLGILDPLAGMAGKDPKKLNEVLRSFETGDEVLIGFFSELSKGAGADGTDGLELDTVDTGSKGASPGAAGEELPASNVRMFQLFMTTDTWPPFQKMLMFLGEELGADNPTDCVVRCVTKVYKMLKKEKKEKAGSSK